MLTWVCWNAGTLSPSADAVADLVGRLQGLVEPGAADDQWFSAEVYSQLFSDGGIRSESWC